MIDLLDLFAPGAVWPEKHPETGEDLVSVDAIVGGGEVRFVFHGSWSSASASWIGDRWRWASDLSVDRTADGAPQR